MVAQFGDVVAQFGDVVTEFGNTVCGVRRRGPENPCTVYIIYPCKFGGENPSNVFFL